jgi:hypothetical protein
LKLRKARRQANLPILWIKGTAQQLEKVMIIQKTGSNQKLVLM